MGRRSGADNRVQCRRAFEWRLGVVLAALAGALGYWSEGTMPLVRMQTPAERFSRRSGDLTVNLCGALSPLARSARYRVNGGRWHVLRGEPPRNYAPFFTIELEAAELRPGANELLIEASGYARLRPSVTRLQFEYDPSPVRLPIVLDWKGRRVEVEEGLWETYGAGGEWRARPKPGYEGYDRIAMVSGAFAGGRRVRVEMVFRGRAGSGPFGFGVMPLWGGRPDAAHDGPRRGLLFSIAWYSQGFEGVGQQFSMKKGGAPAVWHACSRNFSPRPDSRYVVVAEAWPMHDAAGRPAGYYQRMKLWVSGQQEPAEWVELVCDEGKPLPSGEYAVALIAHRCQVEFGPVLVERLGPVPARR